MGWLIAVGLGALTTYELWAVFAHRRTLSRWVWMLSARWPILPFAVGFLMGHWFA